MTRTDPFKMVLAAEVRNNPGEERGLPGHGGHPLRPVLGPGDSRFFCDLSAEQEFEDLLWETGLLGPDRP